MPRKSFVAFSTQVSGPLVPLRASPRSGYDEERERDHDPTSFTTDQEEGQS
jgi:hypothetical protein